ncbi:hypothetical protein C465_06528 [Halorubrum distributum JCM 9100]|uniref:Phosphate transport regulator n=5 Tax=Halorubrum distributum TaxID=29283 RepID=M0EPZ6_9EURY|nr:MULTISPECIES: DUF47 family protein [Halorubrum distributum group]ELZ49876.1 hypothetical protein C465_06528 [Halorubrum distributum JCM 9100]ELZ57071.1 hypothetical protein C466_03209 [Halorubrum distributum JCM 10118]EMA58490.1 hypothetical protein C470_12463 [Halorubrum litoreum JCM 13561]EMA68609.1 hypothetical protein C462_13671 [Halorubrum arcis JCM 13916]MDV7349044.1 DUF47 family protein [Halorubrum distributum]
MATDADFGERLETRTVAYLDRIDDCVALLPRALDQFATEGGFDETVDEIAAVESECDDLVRELTALITDAGPDDIGLLNTRINFNESALLDFYNELDVVANHTERIVQEVAMMRPAADVDPFDDMREMADRIAEMTDVLADVVEGFVRGLARADATETLAEGIESIRALESECDDLRNDAIETAFADGSIDQPLVYRELAILLDELANTIEDLTDRIVVIASKEPGIVTDADGE